MNSLTIIIDDIKISRYYLITYKTDECKNIHRLASLVLFNNQDNNGIEKVKTFLLQVMNRGEKKEVVLKF